MLLVFAATAPEIVLQKLDAAVAQYRSLTFATSTQQSYRSHLKAYMDYCEMTNQSPLPLTSQNLCRYVAYLATKLSYSSIGKYLNIVRILHLEAGFPNPLSANWILSSVMKGVKRDKGSASSQKLAITPQILLRLRVQLCLEEPRDIVFWAACLVAFFGLLRKSNLLPTTPNKFSTQTHLSKQALCITPYGYVLTVSWSKTIQYKERELKLTLPLISSHPLCPVAAVTNLLRLNVGVPQSGPLFSFPTPGGIHIYTQREFVNRLHKLLGSAGLNSHEYSGHSFRRGGATWAFAAGLPADMIRLMGDWRSNAYQRYIDPSPYMKFHLLKPFVACLPEI